MVRINPLTWAKVNQYSNFISDKQKSATNPIQKAEKFQFKNNNISFAASNPVDSFTPSPSVIVPVKVIAAVSDAQSTYLDVQNLLESLDKKIKPVSNSINTYAQEIYAKAEEVKSEVEKSYANSQPGDNNVEITDIGSDMNVMKEYKDKQLTRRSVFVGGELVVVHEITKHKTSLLPEEKNVFTFQNGNLIAYDENSKDSGASKKISKRLIFTDSDVSEYDENYETADKTITSEKTVLFKNGKLSEYKEGLKVSKEGIEADKVIRYDDGKLYRYIEGYKKLSDGTITEDVKLKIVPDGKVEYTEGHKLSPNGMEIAKSLEYEGTKINLYNEGVEYSNGVLRMARKLEYADGEPVKYTENLSSDKCSKDYTFKDGKWTCKDCK